MDNFRDSYFQINWDLGKKRLNNSVWGKQYDTGRGLAITLISNGVVVTPSTEIIRLKWEKSDGTAGYVNSTIVSGKFLIENIDQMFTVAGMVKADLELQVAGEFVASVTFFVSVDKAIAVDAIESSSEFTALQQALIDSAQQLADFEAAAAAVTVDTEVILARTSTAKDKIFATIKTRLEEIEETSSLMATNKVLNGDFISTASWSANNSTISVENNRLKVTALGAWATVGQTIPTTIGNKYYVSAEMEGVTNNYFQFVSPKYKTITGNERLSSIVTATAASHIFAVGDKSSAGWLPYYCDKAIIVDLTATFGAGNEPSLLDFQSYINHFPSLWFDGRKNLISSVAELKRIIDLEYIADYGNIATEGKNLLVFGDSVTETATISDDGSTYTEGTRSNWVTYSKDTLRVGQLWNYAMNGASYKSWSSVLRQKISHQIETAIANNRPGDVIVVSAGTNDGTDLLGDYATAMAKTTLESLDKLKLYEAIRWAFWTLRLNYPNAFCFVVTPIQRADREPLTALSNAIKQMANRYNFIVVDAEYESGVVKDFEVWQGSGRDLSDGLHPKVSGQIKMSNLINKTILNHLNNAT